MKWGYWGWGTAVLLLIWVVGQWPDGKMHLVFCDVGQGDATVVIKGSFQALIDTGSSGEAVLSCLGDNLPFWDRKIELVINSHPEKDHLGGLDEVMERYSVGKLIINGIYKEGKDASKIRETVIERGIEVVVPEKGDVIRYTDLQFDVLWPEEKQGKALAWNSFGSSQVLGESDSVNEISVVVLLKYKEFEALLTGDIGEAQEKRITEAVDLEGIEVLKVAHHGSKFSSSSEFLAKMRPREAVIMVGKNSFGHPTGEVLERLAVVGARVWRTDKEGEVELITDGKSYVVTGKKE